VRGESRIIRKVGFLIRTEKAAAYRRNGRQGERGFRLSLAVFWLQEEKSLRDAGGLIISNRASCFGIGIRMRIGGR